MYAGARRERGRIHRAPAAGAAGPRGLGDAPVRVPLREVRPGVRGPATAERIGRGGALPGLRPRRGPNHADFVFGDVLGQGLPAAGAIPPAAGPQRVAEEVDGSAREGEGRGEAREEVAMPLYEYYCDPCNGIFASIRPMREASFPLPCPECNRDAGRIMSSFNAFPFRDGYPRRLPDKGTFWHMGKVVKQRANGLR